MLRLQGSMREHMHHNQGEDEVAGEYKVVVPCKNQVYIEIEKCQKTGKEGCCASIHYVWKRSLKRETDKQMNANKACRIIQEFCRKMVLCGENSLKSMVLSVSADITARAVNEISFFEYQVIANNKIVRSNLKRLLFRLLSLCFWRHGYVVQKKRNDEECKDFPHICWKGILKGFGYAVKPYMYFIGSEVQVYSSAAKMVATFESLCLEITEKGHFQKVSSEKSLDFMRSYFSYVHDFHVYDYRTKVDKLYSIEYEIERLIEMGSIHQNVILTDMDSETHLENIKKKILKIGGKQSIMHLQKKVENNNLESDELLDLTFCPAKCFYKESLFYGPHQGDQKLWEYRHFPCYKEYLNHELRMKHDFQVSKSFIRNRCSEPTKRAYFQKDEYWLAMFHDLLQTPCNLIKARGFFQELKFLMRKCQMGKGDEREYVENFCKLVKRESRKYQKGVEDWGNIADMMQNAMLALVQRLSLTFDANSIRMWKQEYRMVVNAMDDIMTLQGPVTCSDIDYLLSAYSSNIPYAAEFMQSLCQEAKKESAAAPSPNLKNLAIAIFIIRMLVFIDELTVECMKSYGNEQLTILRRASAEDAAKMDAQYLIWTLQGTKTRACEDIFKRYIFGIRPQNVWNACRAFQGDNEELHNFHYKFLIQRCLCENILQGGGADSTLPETLCMDMYYLKVISKSFNTNIYLLTWAAKMWFLSKNMEGEEKLKDAFQFKSIEFIFNAYAKSEHYEVDSNDPYKATCDFIKFLREVSIQAFFIVDGNRDLDHKEQIFSELCEKPLLKDMFNWKEDCMFNWAKQKMMQIVHAVVIDKIHGAEKQILPPQFHFLVCHIHKMAVCLRKIIDLNMDSLEATLYRPLVKKMVEKRVVTLI